MRNISAAVDIATATAVTKCKLCNHPIQGDRIPILGEDAAMKVQRLMLAMMTHYQERHTNNLVEVMRASQHYTTLLILQQFELIDQPLIEAREAARKFAEECLNKGRPD
jgi:hypothetical protein